MEYGWPNVHEGTTEEYQVVDAMKQYSLFLIDEEDECLGSISLNEVTRCMESLNRGSQYDNEWSTRTCFELLNGTDPAFATTPKGYDSFWA